MKENVSEYEFINRFDQIDRSESFSITGRKALFEYFETLEEDLGEELDFDPIAICCEWSEYGDEEEAKEACGLDLNEDLEDKTIVIHLDNGGILLLDF